jgi:aminoglycoside 6-adenylyltransferase
VPENDVLRSLVGWARGRRDVRAMILTSTQARPEGPPDDLSDYDVILAVNEPARFAEDDAWTHDFARPLVRWSDEASLHGYTTHFRGVVYENGVKIDWTIWPLALLDEIARHDLPDELDVGYRILLDEDGRTVRWPPPAYRAHTPARPTAEDYRALVEEFFWGATYAVKSLRRGELLFTKFVVDFDMKLGALRRMLEWRVELDHDWSLPVGVFGRGLEKTLPPEVWAALEITYTGLEPEANREALRRTIDLFRRVATEVGDALGYEYPQDVDDQVSSSLSY